MLRLYSIPKLFLPRKHSYRIEKYFSIQYFVPIEFTCWESWRTAVVCISIRSATRNEFIHKESNVIITFDDSEIIASSATCYLHSFHCSSAYSCTTHFVVSRRRWDNSRWMRRKPDPARADPTIAEGKWNTMLLIYLQIGSDIVITCRQFWSGSWRRSSW